MGLFGQETPLKGSAVLSIDSLLRILIAFICQDNEKNDFPVKIKTKLKTSEAKKLFNGRNKTKWQRSVLLTNVINKPIMGRQWQITGKKNMTNNA